MKRIVFLLWLGCWSVIAGAQLKTVPSFAACSVYYPSVKGLLCRVSYKEAGGAAWLPAIDPVYDPVLQEYRVSIVRLKENTAYVARAEQVEAGNVVQTDTSGFVTWNASPPVIKTIRLSEFMKTGQGFIDIKGVKGTAAGWVKIIGDTTVKGDKQNDYALAFSDCHFIILEGATITGGNKHAVFADKSSDNLRIINCDISGWGRIPVTQDSAGLYRDQHHQAINNDAGIRLEYPLNVVVERCYIHDHTGFTNPWNGVVSLGALKGHVFKRTHPAGPNAVFVKYARQGVVLRYNDFIGSQTHRFNDPVETAENGSIDGGFNRDADIYGNMMAFGEDDGIELDGAQCNVRMFDNRLEQTMTGISTAPNKRGPAYIFNNLVWNLGNSNGISTYGVKNGGGNSHSFGMQYFINNTLLAGNTPMMGVGYGSDTNRSLFHAWSRNNIYAVTPAPDKAGVQANTPSIDERSPSQRSSFDYDMIGNTVAPEGKGSLHTLAAHESHAVYASPSFTNAGGGVFTVTPADRGIDKGVPVPNFTKTAGIDMGALSAGASTLMPARPVDMEASQYHLDLIPGKPETITITLHTIGGSHKYMVYKSNDMSWLSVDNTAGTVSDNTTVSIRLTAGENKVNKGAILFRLDNGFSIPVTIKVKGN